MRQTNCLLVKRQTFHGKQNGAFQAMLTGFSVLMLLFQLLPNVLAAQSPSVANSRLITRTNPKSYRVRIKLNVTNKGSDLRKLILVLPLAQTNQYQDVTDIRIHGADILPIPQSDDRYVRFIAEAGQVPKNLETKEWHYDFTVTLYDVATDFTKISIIYPYNKNTELYKSPRVGS